MKGRNIYKKSKDETTERKKERKKEMYVENAKRKGGMRGKERKKNYIIKQKERVKERKPKGDSLFFNSLVSQVSETKKLLHAKLVQLLSAT